MSDSRLLTIVNMVLQHGPVYSMIIQNSDQRVTRVTITLESIQQSGMCICRTVTGRRITMTMQEFIDLMRTSLEQSVDDASADISGDASADISGDASAGVPDGPTGVPEVMDRLRL